MYRLQQAVGEDTWAPWETFQRRGPVNCQVCRAEMPDGEALNRWRCAECRHLNFQHACDMGSEARATLLCGVRAALPVYALGEE